MALDGARWARIAGLVVGLAAAIAFATGPQSWLGLGPALAVPVFATLLLAGVLIGELLAAPPSGRTRTAVIEVRRARSYLPRAAVRVVAATVAVLAAYLVAGALTASQDDLGRAGRTLTLTCQAGRNTVSNWGAGPWPGSYYGVPIGLGVLAGLVVAATATWMITRRPRPELTGGDPASGIEADDARRRASARTVVAACGVLAAAPLAGVALTAGLPLWQAADAACASFWGRPLAIASLVVAAAAGVTACVFTVRLISPRLPVA